MKVIYRDYKGDAELRLGPLTIRQHEPDLDGYVIGEGYRWLVDFAFWRVHVILGWTEWEKE